MILYRLLKNMWFIGFQNQVEMRLFQIDIFP